MQKACIFVYTNYIKSLNLSSLSPLPPLFYSILSYQILSYLIVSYHPLSFPPLVPNFAPLTSPIFPHFPYFSPQFPSSLLSTSPFFTFLTSPPLSPPLLSSRYLTSPLLIYLPPYLPYFPTPNFTNPSSFLYST